MGSIVHPLSPQQASSAVCCLVSQDQWLPCGWAMPNYQQVVPPLYLFDRLSSLPVLS
ncbi:hypothetical protein M378DRAFT_160166, partial [Amanita muscaria Koide BX008]